MPALASLMFVAPTQSYAVPTIDTDFLYLGFQDYTPTGVTFNNDGSKVYVIGDYSDSVYEYSLGTPFDVNSASISNVQSFPVLSQDYNPEGVTFNNDGSKMYVIGDSTDSVYEYSLSIPFAISSASYTGNYFSVTTSSQVFYSTDVTFNNDGSKMYVTGGVYNSVYEFSVYEYSLTTDFLVTSASYTGNSIDVSSQDNYSTDVTFNNDGSKMYVIGDSTDSVYEYSLSIPFAVSSASYTGNSFNVRSETYYPTGVTFNDDGSKMYVTGNTYVYEYSLSTPFAITSASFINDSFSVSSQVSDLVGVTFNDDGSKMYVIGGYYGSVYEYSLTTNFLVTSASYTGNSIDVSSQDNYPTGVTFNNLGSKMYVIGDSTDSVYEYSLSIPFAVSSASYTGNSIDVSSQDYTPTGVTFNNDGSKMYVVGDSTDSVYEYSLGADFVLNTASFTGKSFPVSSQDSSAEGVTFNNDGSKMYVIGDSTDSVYEYSLGTPFDVSSATYTGNSIDVSSQDYTPTGVTFNNDGSKMYVMGDSSNSVYEYSLSIPFAIAESIPPLTGSSSTTGNVSIQSTCGIGLSSGAPISYGALAPNEISTEQTLVLQNTGNINATTFVSGTSWLDSSNSTIITIDNTKYSSSTGDYSTKTSLTTDDTSLMVIQPSVNTDTFWQLQATLADTSFSGNLTQTVNFAATC